MAGKYMKGALIEFMEAFLLPVPNVILFQYNPETMTHTLSEATSAGAAESTGHGSGRNPLAVRSFPTESFSFTIAMDSNDTIADKMATAPIAEVSGVYSRLAALEMLQYPVTTGGTGIAGASATAALRGFTAGLSGPRRNIPAMQVPTVLFIWGPGRIVPVRVTGLTITEKLYDTLLNPTHAEAQLSLKVLTPDELRSVNGPLKEIAKAAYVYSHGLRQALAVANLANATESIIGLLPV